MRLWCRFFVVALFSPLFMDVVQAKSQAEVSLDSLVDRVDSYWKLLLEGNKLQAASFIIPSKRDEFLAGNIPQFSNPRLASLELTADRKEATVTVIVRRPIPYPFNQLDWPVKGRWVFEKKRWYLIPEKAFIPILMENDASSTQVEAAQNDSAKREMQRMLQFKESILDFGTIRQGTQISVKLQYTLTSDKPLFVTVLSAVPDLEVFGLHEQSLLPGEARELTIELPSRLYAGNVSERIVLLCRNQGVQVPFEFEIKGDVFEPVAVTPKLLRFDLNGNPEKVILVRNNLKSTIELESFFSETNTIKIEPLPVTIPPGAEMQMKVSQVRGITPHNLYDNLSIRLAQPVDGVSRVSLTVVLNFKEEKNPQADGPTPGVDIQDLIRKNRIDIPNR